MAVNARNTVLSWTVLVKFVALASSGWCAAGPILSALDGDASGTARAWRATYDQGQPRHVPRARVARRPSRLVPPATALIFGGLMLALVHRLGLAVAHQRILSGGNGVVLLYLAFAVVGVVVAWHQPGNPIGWALLGVGLFFTLSGASGVYTVFDYRARQGTLPLGWLAVLLQPSWAPAVALAGLSLLLFPDGRFPSRRWRPVLWAYLGVGGLWVAGAYAITAGAILTGHVHAAANGDLAALNNPTGTAATWGVLGTVFFALIAVSWLMTGRPGGRLPAAARCSAACSSNGC